MHTVHHEHTTLSPHRRCERTLHSLALVHWWPQMTTNSRCHQQLGPHNTKHNITTRVPNTTLQQTSSPDITTVSNTLYNRTSWTTQHALSSDHLPIITTIIIRHDYRLQQNRRTFTNYKKADWTQFTEYTFAQTTIPTANRIVTNIILVTEKHNIPKGKMHSNCRLLPEDILCKITQRYNIRNCDPALKLLNDEITSDIQKHKQNIWKEHVDAHWDQWHNTHTLWKTIHGISNREPPQTLYTSITFNNKIATTPKYIANCFTKQFTNTVKHTKQTDTLTKQHTTYNITLNTSQVQEAIKQSKNNNSQGPDKLNIRHLKHIGPHGLAFLASIFKTALNKNIIPHTWKLDNIVPIPNPNKDTDNGTLYMPISLLSVIAKTLEKKLLPYITENIPNTPMQHGYKTQHSTVTALHTLNKTVAKWFNQMAPPARTITQALDMSKAFDTINIHTLIRKLLQTIIPGTIIKFIANYIKGRKAYTTYRNHTSKQRQFKTGVPQGGVLSPTLFDIYTSDLPPPSAPIQVMAYADDFIIHVHTSNQPFKLVITPSYFYKAYISHLTHHFLTSNPFFKLWSLHYHTSFSSNLYLQQTMNNHRSLPYIHLQSDKSHLLHRHRYYNYFFQSNQLCHTLSLDLVFLTFFHSTVRLLVSVTILFTPIASFSVFSLLSVSVFLPSFPLSLSLFPRQINLS